MQANGLEERLKIVRDALLGRAVPHGREEAKKKRSAG